MMNASIIRMQKEKQSSMEEKSITNTQVWKLLHSLSSAEIMMHAYVCTYLMQKEKRLQSWM